MTKKELVVQARGIANTIGYDLEVTYRGSDDPLLGYEYKDLTYLVGQEAVDSYLKQNTLEELKALEGKELGIGLPAVATRGKMKGIKGWINAEMPSQYNEGELAYLVISLNGESGWVAKKSLKLRVPEVGERDLQAKCKAKGQEVKKWERGSKVVCEGRTGHLVGYGKKDEDQPVPTVAVQWEGASREEWIIASTLERT